MSFRDFVDAPLSVSGYEPEYAFRLNFIRAHKNKDVVFSFEHYSIGESSLLEFAHEVADYFHQSLSTVEKPLITGYMNGVICIEITKPHVLIIVSRQNTSSGITVASRASVNVEIGAAPETLLKVKKYFDDKYLSIREAAIQWWYVNRSGPDSITINLGANTKTVCQEFYPFLHLNHKPIDPDSFFKAYMQSSAPLMFMSGPPGTGKTSLLRHFIVKNGLKTYVAYDEKLFDNDQLFMSFFSSDATLMVFEDAENLVLPRDRGNSMMARFLNVSDGLLKFPDKKIVFTTNESNFERIDSALVRKGRCFSFVQFRNLTAKETIAAAEKAGVPAPKDGDEHSLAEIFNQDCDDMFQIPKIGFR